MQAEKPIKAYRFETKLERDDIVFYDVKDEPFEVYGLYNYKNEDSFIRLPDEVAAATSPSVHSLSKQSAGGRIRFSTDAPLIVVKAIFNRIVRHDHMPLTSSAGMDVYIDGEGGSIYYQTVRPGVDVKNEYTVVVNFGSQQERKLTINMPLFSEVAKVYIGMPESASVGRGLQYINKHPIVYYGSSITHGACSSRPGLCYENIISRRYNLDYVNLGFSGNAKGEDAICEYMASMDMSVFVSDYDHNASVAGLKATHSRLYDTVRRKNPDIPYVMITRPDLIGKYDDAYDRRDIVLDTFRYARSKGDKNVYFIDGEGFFRGPDADCCTVDGTHPNDLGFMKMANSIGCVIERAVNSLIIGGKEI